MTRGLRLPRFSWLLALVLVLSVLTVPYAPPAAGHHEVDVWSATLTAKPDIAVGVTLLRGCFESGATECSASGALSASEVFEYDGVTYSIEKVLLDDAAFAPVRLALVLDVSVTDEAMAALTLRVGNREFPFAEATRVANDAATAPNVLNRIRWDDAELVWTDDQQVPLRITPPKLVHAGDLDPTFGIGGKVTTAFGGVTSEIFDMVEQPDGKIVAVGFAHNGTNKDFAVVRYNPDGSLDTGFGDEGRVLTNFTVPGSHNGLDDEARAVVLQSDNKIVVAGYAANPNLGKEFVVARYNVDGSLDTGFGPEYAGSKRGFAVQNFVVSAQDDIANAVAIQTVGGTERILLAGQAGNVFGLVRFTAAGVLDTGFGAVVNNVSRTGVKTVNFSQGADGANAVAIGADNKIIAAGFTTNNNGTTTGANPTADDHKDFALLRLSGVGDEDSTFGTNGRVTRNITAGKDDVINDIAIQSNGKIVAAGYSIGTINNVVSGPRLTLARFNTGGVLDGEFGTLVGSGPNRMGHVTTLAPEMDSSNPANAVAIQSDGKIVAAGNASASFAVYRYTSAGDLDTSFSTDGRATVRVGDDSNDDARAIALMDDGGILLGGRAGKGSLVYDFALARLTSAGALDEDGDFGAGGIVTTSFSSDETETTAMAVQSDGKIVVVGINENSEKFGLARYESSGLLDNGFGTAGRVTTNFGAGKEDAAAVAIDSSGKIVVAGRTHNGTNYDIAVARYTSAGALDTAFSTDGKATVFFGDSNIYPERALAAAVQSDDKIVVAGYMTSDNGTPTNTNDDHRDFALVRFNTDGTLDTGFGTGGRVSTAISSANDQINALVIDPDGKIVVAGNGFALARYNANGSLDTGFGTGGTVATSIGTDAKANALAIDSDGKIVAAGTANTDFALARYNANGSLDTGFGASGTVTTDISTADDESDEASAVAIQSDGKILAAGNARDFSNFSGPLALVRYNADGTLDTGFGAAGTGKVTTDLNANGFDTAIAIALRPAGKILVAVSTLDPYLNVGVFGLVRYVEQTPLSTDATLSGLSVSTSTDGTTFDGTATLSPAFASGTLSYSTTLRSTVTHVKVTPTVADTKATVTVQGTATASGTASAAIAVTEGTASTVNAVVTAEDGTTTAIYTITVEVESGDATLSALAVSSSTDGSTFGGTVPLMPAFKPATTSYSASAGPDVTHVKVTPTVSDAIASVTVQGTTTTSGTASAAIAVSTGTTTNVSVVVTAQDNQVSTTYTVAVHVGSVVTIAVAPNPVAEGSSAQITVTITEAKATDISIPLVVTAGSAESGDYSAPSSVPIKAGATSGTATLKALQDTDIDDETLTVALGTSLPADLNAGSPNSVLVTIDDDEAVSTVTLGQPDPVREGQAVRIRVNVSPTQPKPLTIPLTLTNVSSESGDYSGPSSVTIGAGQSMGFARIQTNHDEDAQDEQFTVALGSNLPLLATAGTPGSVTVTIDDDEVQSTVSIKRALAKPFDQDGVVEEGETLYLAVGVSPAQPNRITIPLTFTNASAESNDYSAPSSVTIEAGQVEGVVQVRTFHDSDAQDEYFTVELGSDLPMLVTAGTPSSVTIIIDDDEFASEVSIARILPERIPEGESAYVTLSIAPASPVSVTIPITLTRGSAESGDYAALTSITIPAGQPQGVALLRTLHDSDADDETLTVALGANLPDLVTAGPTSSMVVTIDDDEVETRVWIKQVLADPIGPYGVVGEGQTLYVVVGVSHAHSNRITIPLTFTNVSAESGDYSGPSSVTIEPGYVEGVAQVRALHDSDEQDEQFTIALGANLPLLTTAGTPNSVTVTIEDDEFSSAVSIAQVSPNPVLEGESAYVVLRMAPASSVSVTIPITLTRGSAESGDYASLTSITIPAGQSQMNAELRTFHDSDTDDETLTVSLGASLPDLVTAGATTSMVLTIEDDDDVVQPRQRPGVYDLQAGNGSLTVTWFIRDDHSPYASFDVQYRVKGTTSWSSASAGATLHDGEGRHTISGLNNGTTYEVRVRARNAAGAGPWSWPNEEGAPSAPPAAPTISSVQPSARSTYQTLHVAWSSVSSATYHLRYREQGASTWQRWQSPNNDVWHRSFTTSQTLYGLSPGTTYEVQVRAVIGDSIGPWSASATGTTNSS